MKSSCLALFACCAIISLTCEIRVPNKQAEKRKRKMQ